MAAATRSPGPSKALQGCSPPSSKEASQSRNGDIGNPLPDSTQDEHALTLPPFAVIGLAMRIGLRHFEAETVGWLREQAGRGVLRSALARGIYEMEGWVNDAGEPCVSSALTVLRDADGERQHGTGHSRLSRVSDYGWCLEGRKPDGPPVLPFVEC